MWKKFWILDISTNNNGIFFFKFRTEIGMLNAIDKGPWLVNDIPLCIKKWEAGICIEKLEPSSIPLWVTIPNLPLELWNSESICSMLSCIGEPILFDKVTAERCGMKEGPPGFARVLVEVNADTILPDYVKTYYPEDEGTLVFIKEVKVVYQMKVMKCSACKVFGHDFVSCTKRMLSTDEFSAKAQKLLNDIKEIDRSVVPVSGVVSNDFQVVGKNNKVIKVIDGKHGSMKGRVNSYKKDLGSGIKSNGHGAMAKDSKGGEYRVKKQSSFVTKKGVFKDVNEIKTGNRFDVLGNENEEGLKNEIVKDIGTVEKDKGENRESEVKGGSDMKESLVDKENNDTDMKESVIKSVIASEVLKDSNHRSLESGINTKSGYFKMSEEQFNEVAHFIIHCEVSSIEDGEVFYCSFVYGFTKVPGRRTLWDELVKFNKGIHDKPWAVLGDFNAILHPSEKSNVQNRVNYGMEDFKRCVNEVELCDITMSGLHYTWNQKPGKCGGILEKLDRVMGNQKFGEVFPAAFAKFLPFYTSDHSPALLVLASRSKSTHKPFKFWSYLMSKEEFIPIVKERWGVRVDGCKMFRVVSKLKTLKKPLRKMKFSHGNLHDKVEKLRIEVERIQKAIVEDHDNGDLRNEEAIYVKEYKVAVADVECMLKQKSRVHWLKVGDQNSKYFHHSVKNRESRNKISSIKDLEGNEYSGDKVGDALVKYFKGIMGKKANLSDQEAEQLVSTVSNEEVKDAMFQIADDKAPGPDGFTANFFKAA
ncbi:uncharacterized protein LOC110933481 [Helianthus annuus]|uniref:uncharacterized protein LOC110933481 n=1 Tax=Helianthus annuus TaxID=4232 RepID=UPI0016530528|nr:uncharacterized protein LOC110933481 [Helianthus annuus]